MAFNLFIDNQADILPRLIKVYYPSEQPRIIDLTYGTGALWWNVEGQFNLTKCDAVPAGTKSDIVIQKDITKDSYAELGKFDIAVFDPPYLIGRKHSFDYPFHQGQGVVPTAYQGKRSWGANSLSRFTANETIDIFNERVDNLNIKAKEFLNDNGLIMVKIMDVRNDGILTAHHINIANKLTNFDLIDLAVYVRQGATTWKIKGHLQSLYGFWMVFKKKGIENQAKLLIGVNADVSASPDVIKSMSSA